MGESWMFQVVQEYERAVIFRLGRLCSGGAKVRPDKIERERDCPGGAAGTRDILHSSLCGHLPVC